MQPGDMVETYADVDDLMQEVGFRPATAIKEGLGRFDEWHIEFKYIRWVYTSSKFFIFDLAEPILLQPVVKNKKL